MKEEKDLSLEINYLKDKVEKIEKKVQKLLKDQGDRNILSFEIKGDDQWDHIERNLLQSGIILEHEISRKLTDMEIIHDQNCTFKYPSEKGKFMIDYSFSNENEFYRFPEFEKIKSRLFETDLWIDNDYDYSDDKFNIRVTTYYLIECKSRANPPINYLFLPNKTGLNLLKDPKKSFFQLKGSKLLPFLNIDLDSIWRTRHNIIQIRHPKLDIDSKDTLNEAFWQLFRRIDYEKNRRDFFTPFNLNLLDIDYFKNKIAKEFEFHHYTHLLQDYYIESFNSYYRKLKDNNIIDKILNEKIDLKISIYVPIIVVNGNIYSIDLESNVNNNEKFSECINKEAGFIKHFDYLKMSVNEGEKFIDLTRFLMDFLKEIGITDEILFPINFNPELDVLVLSSSNFSKTFLTIKDLLEGLIESRIEKLAKTLLLQKREEIVHLLIFDWTLLNNPKFLDEFTLRAYKRYKEFREKNFRSSFQF